MSEQWWRWWWWGWSLPKPDQIHLWMTYGWTIIFIITILVIISIILSTILHYSYRMRWRTLDILLTGVLLQELPNIFTMMLISSSYSSLIDFNCLTFSSLVSSQNDSFDHHHHHHHQDDQTTRRIINDLFLWINQSSRFFQISLITALIVDRALILKWPYQYRFTIRHSQIRFLMILIALIALIFGAFAVVSHQNDRYPNDYGTIFDRDGFRNLSSQSKIANQSILFEQSTATNDSSTKEFLPFSFSPLIYDAYYSYFFITIYSVFTLICLVCFVYVEIQRPRPSSSLSSCSKYSCRSNNLKHQQQQQQRYLQSFFTLFKSTPSSASSSATTPKPSHLSSSTGTSSSSSASSSLTASSLPPSRFSSLANLTNNSSVPIINDHHHRNQSSTQSSTLPSFYYPNVIGNKLQSNQNQKHRTDHGDNLDENQCQPLRNSSDQSSQYPLTLGDGLIVQQQDNQSPITSNSTFTSITTSDNSIQRLIDVTGSNDCAKDDSKIQQERSEKKIEISDENDTFDRTRTDIVHNGDSVTKTFEHRSSSSSTQSQSLKLASKIEMSNSALSRMNSFMKSQQNIYPNSHLKFESNDEEAFLNHQQKHHHRNQYHHHYHYQSAFDLRWSSVAGPVSFCFAFNHGPYLIFILFAMFVPSTWTPLHDLILAGLSLLQALLLPLIIFISNKTFRSAVIRSFCWCHYRRHRLHYLHREDFYSDAHKISSLSSSKLDQSRNHRQHSKSFDSTLAFISVSQDEDADLSSTKNKSKQSHRLERSTNQPPPPYYQASKKLASVLQSYHSEFNLLQPESFQNRSDHQHHLSSMSSTSKASKQSFVVNQNSKEFRNRNDRSGKLFHATSMLDLSLSSNSSIRNVFGHLHSNPSQTQTPHSMAYKFRQNSNNSNGTNNNNNNHSHQQQQQSHHHNPNQTSSRSRYSLALAHQLSVPNANSNETVVTPKSLFNRRPPSVASYHYLFSTQSPSFSSSTASSSSSSSASKLGSTKQDQQQQKQQQQQSSFLESQISNQNRWSQYFPFGGAAPYRSKSQSTLFTVADNQSTKASVPNQLSSNIKNHFPKEGCVKAVAMAKQKQQSNSNNSKQKKSMNKKFIAEDKFLPNHSLKQSICDEEIDDIDNDVGSKDPDQNVNPNKMKLKSSGPKLIELISNLATKSSFRNRSIRKSDSDASTFYNRHNPLKRSQITENILANDLKQQRKYGKISSSISLFGSEIILLSDNECINENRNGKFVCGTRNEMRSRQSSFENNDSSMFSTNQIFPRPHVYLPNASIEESYHRSNSCQQLSLINGETDHFHNHLFVKHLNGENSSNSNNHLGCENSFVTPSAAEEPIYASLPEEEEDFDEIKHSGTFSARSTLPDNCQLISSPLTSVSIVTTNTSAITTTIALTTTTTSMSKGRNQSSFLFSSPQSPSSHITADGYVNGEEKTESFDDDSGHHRHRKNENDDNSNNNNNNDNVDGIGNFDNANERKKITPSETSSKMMMMMSYAMPDIRNNDVRNADNDGENDNRWNNVESCKYDNGRERIVENDDNNLKINKNPASNNDHCAIVDDVILSEDIYEEVGHSRDDLNFRHSDNDDDNGHQHYDYHYHPKRNLHDKKRSLSEDTLIDGKRFDVDDDNDDSMAINVNSEALGTNTTNYDDDEDDDYFDEEEIDSKLIDEDQISILSETSSSTFSSFTTCANNDFDFIVLKSKIKNQSPEMENNDGDHHNQDQFDRNRSLQQIDQIFSDQLNVDGDSTSMKTNINNNRGIKEPPTLSMAAMYYNRMISNDSIANAKCGHRKRTKLNRRQSFSTAHELRQRILDTNQSKSDRKRSSMDLIEEEIDDSNSQNFLSRLSTSIVKDEFPIFNSNFMETFGKSNNQAHGMNRRISTSEDNLLSIISTVVNCGDDDDDDENARSQFDIDSPRLSAEQTPTKENVRLDQSIIIDQSDCVGNESNGTFVMRKIVSSSDPIQSTMMEAKTKTTTTPTSSSNPINNKNKSSIPRATVNLNQCHQQNSKQISSSSPPPPSSSSLSPSTKKSIETSKITIKELKSKKKQAMAKQNAHSNTNSNNQIINPSRAIQSPQKSMLDQTNQSSSSKLINDKFDNSNSRDNGNGNRVYELGSLWERKSTSSNNNNNIVGSNGSKGELKAKRNYIVSKHQQQQQKKQLAREKEKSNDNSYEIVINENHKSPMKSNQLQQRFVSKQQRQQQEESFERNRNKIPTSIGVDGMESTKSKFSPTSSSSSSSPSPSSSTSSRVPSFISVPSPRTMISSGERNNESIEKATNHNESQQNHQKRSNQFVSKLTPPLEYSLTKVSKQDYRQNALLAKNALLQCDSNGDGGCGTNVDGSVIKNNNNLRKQ